MEVRKTLAEDKIPLVQQMRADGSFNSLLVAALFWVVASGIMLMRERAVPWRPGQYAAADIVSRVKFQYSDRDKLSQQQRDARVREPHVYRATHDVFARIESRLLALPTDVARLKESELPADLRGVLDSGSLNKLQEYSSKAKRGAYDESVRAFVADLRKLDPVILSDMQFEEERGRAIVIPGRPRLDAESVYSSSALFDLKDRLQAIAQKHFLATLAPRIVEIASLDLKPTHERDGPATEQAQNMAADRVPASEGDVVFEKNSVLVTAGRIEDRDWQILRAENEQFLRQSDGFIWWTRFGVVLSAGLLTTILAGYVRLYQARVVRNYARGLALAALLLLMLLISALAGIGSGPVMLLGLAPTILTAMIVTIAYDRRFAAGISTILAAMVTLTLNESVSFFVIALCGVLMACLLLDQVRTRSKLVEVGGLTALVMIVAAMAAGFLRFDPIEFLFRNALFAGLGGLSAGFAVLGILPFIEKTFGITTSMTLLELADVRQPLLRRLSQEAPGTYNHSLQVATLAEEAAEAIGANSLLCRVGAYYHDIGKMLKPEYFVENQSDGPNRHINLTPNVSLLIIIGHVKDGMELAREYGLPRNLLPFIQQHHGTTLVEYFYNRAVEGATEDQQGVSDTQYRYPGPKPKTREIAVVMLADAVESATRSLVDHGASRIEAVVHDIAMRRLLDGQFDESDLTMRDLELIERSLIKSLLGIYHGRIAYPSTMSLTTSQDVQSKTA